MKTFYTIFVMILSVVLLYSCKKETTTIPSVSSIPITSEVASVDNDKWRGEYVAYNYGPRSRSVAQKYFIANGYARIYSDTVRVHKWNYYYTRFKLSIPASRNIDGDNITFEAGVKNPSDASFYIPLHGRDVGLHITGETDSALINNVVPDAIRPDAHDYAIMQIGNNWVNNITALQYIFEDWGTLTLQTFNNGLVAYRNNQYLHGLPYNGAPKIGRLKEIAVSFKGSGFVDWIKLYNSATGELIMSEEFNTDGQSTVIWH